MIRGILEGGSRIGVCRLHHIWSWMILGLCLILRTISGTWERLHRSLSKHFAELCHDRFAGLCRAGLRGGPKSHAHKLRCLRVWSLQFFSFFVGATVRHSNKILCCFPNTTISKLDRAKRGESKHSLRAAYYSIYINQRKVHSMAKVHLRYPRIKFPFLWKCAHVRPMGERAGPMGFLGVKAAQGALLVQFPRQACEGKPETLPTCVFLISMQEICYASVFSASNHVFEVDKLGAVGGGFFSGLGVGGCGVGVRCSCVFLLRLLLLRVNPRALKAMTRMGDPEDTRFQEGGAVLSCALQNPPPLNRSPVMRCVVISKIRMAFLVQLRHLKAAR